MRVALLSTIEAIADAGGDPRGFLTVAGRPVVQHQLEYALAMGCEKIACHAIGLPRELLELQHLAERSGAQFQIIHNARALSGIVRATDELLVIEDSLLADQSLALSLLEQRPCVMAFPADEGVAAGYERIDRDHAWAGLFMVHGSAVERLADLSPDADPVSGLLRIALQSGVHIKMMPKNALAGTDWGLVHSAEEASAFERNWLTQHAKTAPFYAPMLALSDRIGTRLAARAIGPNILYAAAVGMAMIAVIGGAMWSAVAGFILLAIAYLLTRIAAFVARVDAIGRSKPSGKFTIAGLLGIALDLLLVAMVGMASGLHERIGTVLAAAILLMLLRLGNVLSLRKWRIVLADRTLLAVILGIAVAMSQLFLILQIVSMIILTAILVDSSRPKLTRI